MSLRWKLILFCGAYFQFSYAFDAPVDKKCVAHLRMSPEVHKVDKEIGVRKLSLAELAPFRITIKEGLIYRGAEIFTSRQGKYDECMFVIAPDKSIYAIERKGDLEGLIKHSSLADEVIAAGAIKVKDGKLEYISDKSGHFKPSLEHLQQSLVHLRDKGVDITTAVVDISGYKLKGAVINNWQKRIYVAASKFQWIRFVDENPESGFENLKILIPHLNYKNQLPVIIEAIRRGADPKDFIDRMLRISTSKDDSLHVYVSNLLRSYYETRDNEAALRLMDELDVAWRNLAGRRYHLQHWRNILEGRG